MPHTLTQFDTPPPEHTGFQMRDIIRFFTVDIIVTASLRLLELTGFFTNPNQHVTAILASKAVIFLYLLWLIKDKRESWPETGATTIGKWYAYPISIALYAASYPLFLQLDKLNIALMTELYAQIGLIYQHQPQLVTILTFEDILSTPVRIALVGMIVIAGPILEELAFRGMMLDAYRRKRNVVWSVVATGFLFGAYHFSIAYLLPLSALGILFGIARVLGKSLWCSILVHCLHNALTLFLMARHLGVL